MIDDPGDAWSDASLLEEIELLTEIIIAATLRAQRLSVREIDEVLGVATDVGQGQAVPGPRAPEQQTAAPTPSL